MFHSFRLHQVILIVATSTLPAVVIAQEAPSPRSIEPIRHETELHPESCKAFDDLAMAYHAAGQDQQALDVGLKAVALAKKSNNSGLRILEDHLTQIWFQIAMVQSWLGQEAELHATAARALQHAAGTHFATTAERAAKCALLHSSSDKAQVIAALALARR
jgi:hypothetical protein